MPESTKNYSSVQKSNEQRHETTLEHYPCSYLVSVLEGEKPKDLLRKKGLFEEDQIQMYFYISILV